MSEYAADSQRGNHSQEAKMSEYVADSQRGNLSQEAKMSEYAGVALKYIKTFLLSLPTQSLHYRGVDSEEQRT